MKKQMNIWWEKEPPQTEHSACAYGYHIIQPPHHRNALRSQRKAVQ